MRHSIWYGWDRLSCSVFAGRKETAWEPLAAILQLPVQEGTFANGAHTQEGSQDGERNQILVTSFEPLS